MKIIYKPFKAFTNAGAIISKMDIAEQIIKKYDEVFNELPEKGKGSLRYGRSMLSVSNITQQFYCEQQLDLASEFPIPPTEQMIKGEAGHEAAAALGIPVSKEEAIKKAVAEREEAIFFCELDLAWVYKDIPIIGRVDEAWFRGGNVDLVVERKFSNTLKIYNPYHVQAQLYCLGLGEMGFNNESTNYRIIVLKRSCHECKKLMDRACPIFAADEAEYNCDEGGAKSFTYPFNRNIIIKDLDWAIDFWLNRRKAVPTGVQAKCRVCEYSGICEYIK